MASKVKISNLVAAVAGIVKDLCNIAEMMGVRLEEANAVLNFRACLKYLGATQMYSFAESRFPVNPKASSD